MREREAMSAQIFELQNLLTASTHALRSYQHGNGSPVIAATLANANELWLSRNAVDDSQTALRVVSDPQSSGLVDAPFLVPAEMTPAIRDALGTMCFQAGPVAHYLARFGGVEIKRKAEDEQAVVLFWYLSLAVRHGDRWREVANAHLRAIGRSVTDRPSEVSEGRS